MGDEFNKDMCVAEHQHIKEHLDREINNVCTKIGRLEKVVEKLRDRLPPWVTMLLMVLASVIGALATALGYALKTN